MSKHIDYEINKELGECYLFMGEYEKAADYYNKAVACDVGYAAPYLGLATIAMQQGEPEKARLYYSTALELEPCDKGHAGLGLALAEMGKHEEAFASFLTSLKLNPLNMVSMNAMIQTAYRLNRVEEALPRLRASLEVGNDETVRYALAGCLSWLGRDDEARSELEILLGQNPGNASAQELYARIAA